MLRIRFNNVAEFLSELEALCNDYDEVNERRVMRVTNRHTKPATVPIHHVTALASAVVAGHLCTLEVYCGQLWGLDSAPDKRTLETAENVRTAVTEWANARRWPVRSGWVELIGPSAD